MGRVLQKVAADLATADDADKTALLRLFKRNNRFSMTVRELEKLREGQTPWFKEWVRENKIQDKSTEVTPEQLADSDLDLETKNEVIKSIESGLKAKTIPFSSADTALGRPTKAWVLFLDASTIDKVFKVFGPRAVKWLKQASGDHMRSMQKQHGHEHPDAGPGTMTVGWVRYTPLGEVLWVDEIQSDVKLIIGARHVLDHEAQRIQRESADMYEANEAMHDLIKSRLDELDGLTDGLEWLVFRRFMEAHYSSNTILLPTLQFRSKFPGYTSNPVSVYNELPRKARMTRRHVRDVVQIEGIPDGEVWVS